MDAGHSQLIFRRILDGMARPGKVVELPDVKHDVPFDNKYAYLLLFTLLDSYVTFKVLDIKRRADEAEVSKYISLRSGSRESGLEDADFVLVFGGSSGGLITSMKKGTPKYPDESATVIYDVESIGRGSTVLSLSGPGILSSQNLILEGIEKGEIEDLISANSDFPLGIDVVFLDKSGKVACLPRSTTINRTNDRRSN